MFLSCITIGLFLIGSLVEYIDCLAYICYFCKMIDVDPVVG